VGIFHDSSDRYREWLPALVAPMDAAEAEAGGSEYRCGVSVQTSETTLFSLQIPFFQSATFLPCCV
jgi:hypothetical protein